MVYFFHRNWQFFLLDFCYFVNAFVLLFLLGFPNNPQLGAMCWSVPPPLSTLPFFFSAVQPLAAEATSVSEEP